MSRWLLHTIEQTVAAFIAAFVAAATQLPGGIWDSNNWKVAAVAAAGVAFKGLIGKNVGDKNSPALLPMAVETGTKLTVATVTGVVEKGLDETVGKVPVVGVAVDQTVGAVDNIVEDTTASVVGNVTGLLGGLKGLFGAKKN